MEDPSDSSLESVIRTEVNKRHYKKDSRYLGDLYTIAYQEDSLEPDDNHNGVEDDDFSDDVMYVEEDLDEDEINIFYGQPYSEGEPHMLQQNHNPMSLRVLPRTVTTDVIHHGGKSGAKSLVQLRRSDSMGDPPPSAAAKDSGSNEALQKKLTCSILDTNLPKILNRRMQSGQEVSFTATKLLTKAYYQLLREPKVNVSLEPAARPASTRNDPKLNWDTLLQTDEKQLLNIVAGYNALVTSLNEELVQELETKDGLTAEQDSMLETISELTNNLL